MTYFSSSGSSAERREEALKLLSASQGELRQEFADRGDEPAQLAWDTLPFLRHPFVRLGDDSLLLTSKRAMLSWLTEGFHYRLLDAAQSRGREISQAYTSHAGRLLEPYALELMESVHPGERPAGGGRIFGEQRYGTGRRQKDQRRGGGLGPRPHALEISTSRLRAETLIFSSGEMLEEDLERVVSKKVKQLDGCIEALESGEATLPDVNLAEVERIWPVLVTASNLTQFPALWKVIDSQTTGLLDQAKVQPLTLLDIEDYEYLCGLIDQGHSLTTILKRKTTPPYHQMELAAWALDDPAARKLEHLRRWSSRPSSAPGDASWSRLTSPRASRPTPAPQAGSLLRSSQRPFELLARLPHHDATNSACFLPRRREEAPGARSACGCARSRCSA